MSKQTFIAIVAVVGLVSLGGCLGGPVDDGTPADTTPSNDSEATIASTTVSNTMPTLANESRNNTVVYLTSEDEAYEALALEKSDFVNETDFESEALLFVQMRASQTCYMTNVSNLAASNTTLTGDVGVHRTAPADQPCGDAITHPSTFVRVVFDGPVPEQAEMTGVDVDESSPSE